MKGVTPNGITICPHCGDEFNIIEGGQTNDYAWETMECLKCQLAVLVHYKGNETIIWIAQRLKD